MKNVSVTKINWSWFIIVSIITKILFESVYLLDIVPLFSYAGFTTTYDMSSRILGWILFFYFTFLTAPFLKTATSTTSQAVVLLYFFRIIPFTVLCALKTASSPFINSNVVFWTSFIVLARLVPVPNLPKIQGNSNIPFYVIILIIALTILYISIEFTGLRLSINFADIYKYRLEARNFKIPLIMQYIIGPASNLLPVFIIYFVIQKKWKWVAFIIFMCIINFAIAGSKSVLVKMFFCILIAFIKTPSYLKLTIKLIVFLLLATLVLHYFTTINILSSVVVRRVFFIPALLDTYYFEYISKHGPTFFSAMKNTNLPFIIGEIYFSGHEGMRCNNGLFSDAYSNLGILGCIVIPIVYVVFIKICDAAFKQVNSGVVFGATLIIITTLSSSLFTTALLTHGLLLLVLSIYIINSSNWKSI